MKTENRDTQGGKSTQALEKSVRLKMCDFVIVHVLLSQNFEGDCMNQMDQSDWLLPFEPVSSLSRLPIGPRGNIRHESRPIVFNKTVSGAAADL